VVHTIHVYFAQLRWKIEKILDNPYHVITLPGIGYCFNNEAE